MAESGDRDNFVLLNLDDRNKAQIFPANIYTVNGVQITGNDIIMALENGQAGDAKLFSKIFQNTYRYDHSSREWWVFEGPHWVKDTTRKALTSIGILTKIYEEEANKQIMFEKEALESNHKHIACIANKRHANLIIRANELKSLHYREEILKLSSSGHESLGLTGEEWDRNPWYLSCSNCVINLQDGNSFPGKPHDFIRTFSPVGWQGLDFNTPAWSGFIQKLFKDPDESLRFKRTIGRLIAGFHTENAIVVVQTDDEFVKSILFRTFKSIFGNYVSHLGLSSKHNLLSALCNPAGKRFIWEYIHPENKSEVIKAVSSIIHSTTEGDLAGKCSPPHVILIMNPCEKYLSNIAQLGRQIYSFNLALPDNYHKDLFLAEKFQNELPGILAYFVKGCIDWYKHGIDPSDKMVVQ